MTRNQLRARSGRWRIGLAALLPAGMLLVGLIGANPASAAPSDTPPVPGVPNQGPITGLDGSCLDDWGQNVYPGAPVDAYPCNGTAAQQWTWVPWAQAIVLSDTYYLNPAYCLDVNDGSDQPGTKVQIWPCNLQKSQQWYQWPDGALDAEGLCLDIPSYKVTPVTATSPVQLQIWGCNGGGANQSWSSVWNLVAPT